MDQNKLKSDSIKHGFNYYRDDNLGGNIIELNETDYHKLLKDGSIQYNEKIFKEKNSSGNLREGRSYIFLEDPEHYLYSFDPIKSIIPFLKNSTLGFYHNQNDPKLVLGLNRNIYEILLGWLSDELILKLPYFESLNEDSFKTDIPPPLESKILQYRDFDGRIGGCGAKGDIYKNVSYMYVEPGCSSEFAWIKDGVCNFYLHTSCTSPDKISFFPFQL